MCTHTQLSVVKPPHYFLFCLVSEFWIVLFIRSVFHSLRPLYFPTPKIKCLKLNSLYYCLLLFVIDMCGPRNVSGGDDERSKSIHVLLTEITKVK